MTEKISIPLASILLVVSSACSLVDKDSGTDEILPGLVAVFVHQLRGQKSVPESLRQLSAQLSEVAGEGPQIELKKEGGLSPEMRSTLGGTASQAVRMVAPDLLQKAGKRPWRTEYSETAGLEVVALDLSRAEQDRKIQMRLRLWVARDSSTLACLLWLLRGGNFWQAPAEQESPAESLFGEAVPPGFLYRTYGVADYSIPLEERNPKLEPDRFGVLVGNVVIEIEGNSYFRLPNRKGWFTTGLLEETLGWRILKRVRSELKSLEGQPTG